MDISRIQLYMRFAISFYIVWLFVNVGQTVAIEPPHTLVLAIIIALALYKFMSLLIVHGFLRRYRCQKPSTLHCEFMCNLTLTMYINIFEFRSIRSC